MQFPYLVKKDWEEIFCSPRWDFFDLWTVATDAKFGQCHTLLISTNGEKGFWLVDPSDHYDIFLTGRCHSLGLLFPHGLTNFPLLPQLNIIWVQDVCGHLAIPSFLGPLPGSFLSLLSNVKKQSSQSMFVILWSQGIRHQDRIRSTRDLLRVTSVKFKEVRKAFRLWCRSDNTEWRRKRKIM